MPSRHNFSLQREARSCFAYSGEQREWDSLTMDDVCYWDTNWRCGYHVVTENKWWSNTTLRDNNCGLNGFRDWCTFRMSTSFPKLLQVYVLLMMINAGKWPRIYMTSVFFSRNLYLSSNNHELKCCLRHVYAILLYSKVANIDILTQMTFNFL